MNDVVIAKIQSLQRCIARVREEASAAGGDLSADITRQDAALLNVIRACELAIDLANHEVRTLRLGIPSDTRESFDLLRDAGCISDAQAASMKSMVGFRNVAVHDYRRLDPAIVGWVLTTGLNELLSFADTMRSAGSG